MRAVIQAAIGKAEEEPIVGAIGDDDSAVHDPAAVWGRGRHCRAARDLRDMP